MPGLSTQDLWLQHADFLVAACGLIAVCTWELVPRPGMEPRPPALGAWSITHWTTREVPENNVYDELCLCVQEESGGKSLK